MIRNLFGGNQVLAELNVDLWGHEASGKSYLKISPVALSEGWPLERALCFLIPRFFEYQLQEAPETLRRNMVKEAAEFLRRDKAGDFQAPPLTQEPKVPGARQFVNYRVSLLADKYQIKVEPNYFQTHPSFGAMIAAMNIVSDTYMRLPGELRRLVFGLMAAALPVWHEQKPDLRRSPITDFVVRLEAQSRKSS